MTMQPKPEQMITRPDGSMIAYKNLDPAKQIEHDLVTVLCDEAQSHHAILAAFKKQAIEEMVAKRQMMMDDHGVSKGGKDGNMTLRSACGRFMVKLTVSKHVTFGPELEAAKALIFEVVEDELEKGGSPFIKDLVTSVFKLNGKGRIDTKGILGLREHKCDDPRWSRAMDAIDEAIRRDAATTYVNFFTCDPSANPKSEGERRISLNLAEV
ncbi:MAG: DUF3164 family protein [Marinovum sp.]|nr:DUF3164 family protein [Marinovum sp.]